GLTQREPGIHDATNYAEKWIPGSRQEARPGMTIVRYEHAIIAAASSEPSGHTMATVKLLSDDELSPEARAVFDDI
ncbi:hypothetical protein ABTM69_21560, partial [Acinetobacter baumannii]